ncbi:MBOAT family protein [Sphingomonas cannabina]|uniref:MBOAT family O-acyltransferase n=1 Tax=Sphingomonas cannabina TaxID=2899123 RepID=UPI001F319A07|nr:MBOAT family O-acyltransferase [Sphingomonas cannabina]UIJ44002.1 MBOAT family protein [Sphingomonas cannabina]
MLFNSDEFLLVFLPIVFVGFLVLAKFRQRRLAALWLTLASLAFYSWWRPANLPLLLLSIAVNYMLGGVLIRRPDKWILAGGILFNVALLGYFKYTVFFMTTLSGALSLDWHIPHVILPLAISFFTFQQIAYLVDAFGGKVSERDPLNYCLFITFFPHLIAGPITHHREMLSQFGSPERFRPRWDLIGIGVTLFLIGLFKKVMVADPFGAIASPIFTFSAETGGVQLVHAWTAALSYALQIYFDFSGYTDMAVGLGLLFGIALPPNFNSPYKARNVIEYWSRWHMTLTRFLTAYVYNPIVVTLTRRRAAKGLPLPRRGRMTPGTFVALVALPTVFTMFVSGVWHGAGWQFVIFGLLHGLYLVVAHGWRAWKVHRGRPLDAGGPLAVATSVLLTFLCVVVALVFFRAPSVGAALDLLAGMAGLNGITLPRPLAGVPGAEVFAQLLGLHFASLENFELSYPLRIAVFLAVVWTLPNAYQWLRDYPTALDFQARASWFGRWLPALHWRPSAALGVVMGAVCAVTLLYALSAAPTEFLYFQF